MASVRDISARAKLGIERARARYGPVDVVVRTFRRYSEDDGGFFAAALTYYAFFSIFPLGLFALSALGYAFFVDPSLRERIIDAGINAFPLLRQVFRPATLERIAEQRGSLALGGLVLALYSGTGGIVALQHALNRVHRIPEKGSFIARRLAALRLLGVVGLLVLLSVALGTLAAAAGGPVGTALAMAAGFAVGTGLFVVVFRLLPARPPEWREVLPGALVAAAAFEVLKQVGALFVASSVENNATFGAFATAATLLASVYIICQVTLLAAELNAALAERRVSRQFSLRDLDGKEASQ